MAIAPMRMLLFVLGLCTVVTVWYYQKQLFHVAISEFVASTANNEGDTAEGVLVPCSPAVAPDDDFVFQIIDAPKPVASSTAGLKNTNSILSGNSNEPLQRAAFPSQLRVCVMFRNQKRYLAEWVAFHRLQGVDQFLFYDDGSTDDFETDLEPFIQTGVVTVFPVKQLKITEEFRQHPDYESIRFSFSRCRRDNRFHAHTQNLCQLAAIVHCVVHSDISGVPWVGIFDVDEFFFIDSDSQKRSIVQTTDSAPQGISFSKQEAAGIHSPEIRILKDIFEQANMKTVSALTVYGILFGHSCIWSADWNGLVTETHVRHPPVDQFSQIVYPKENVSGEKPSFPPQCPPSGPVTTHVPENLSQRLGSSRKSFLRPSAVNLTFHNLAVAEFYVHAAPTKEGDRMSVPSTGPLSNVLGGLRMNHYRHLSLDESFNKGKINLNTWRYDIFTPQTSYPNAIAFLDQVEDRALTKPELVQRIRFCMTRTVQNMFDSLCTSLLNNSTSK